MKNFVTQETMETIATYMEDEIREKVHFEKAPCTPVQFIKRYLELDPGFSNLLWDEFSIDSDEIKELNELSLSELEELDTELLSDKEYHLLEENPEVGNIECLGDSGYRSSDYWHDVRLKNGETINIYTRN